MFLVRNWCPLDRQNGQSLMVWPSTVWYWDRIRAQVLQGNASLLFKYEVKVALCRSRNRKKYAVLQEIARKARRPVENR